MLLNQVAYAILCEIDALKAKLSLQNKQLRFVKSLGKEITDKYFLIMLCLFRQVLKYHSTSTVVDSM